MALAMPTTEQAELTGLSPKHLAKVDPVYWAILNKIRLQKGRWSQEGRQYLIEPMRSEARRLCYMKATQGGFTETEIIKSLHGMIVGKYKGGVLYLFPTARDIQDFSKSRFGPLITSNPRAIGQFIEKTDNATLKRIGDAVLFLRGSTLSKSVGDTVGEMQAAGLRGITVDKVVFDELDIMDDDVIDMAKERMGDSEYEEEVYISNPVLPDSGVAAVFETSDQRHWFRKCLRCEAKDPPETAGLDWFMDPANAWTSAELEFPGCVKYFTKPDRKLGYIACKKCGKPVDNEPGMWVPVKPENSWYMHGYRWSQLSSAKRDPGEILNLYNDPPRKKDEIVRLKLGLPYVAAEDRLTQSEVLGCCGEYNQESSHRGPCAMGIDCQKPKRIVIGARTGRNSFSVFRVMPYADTNWDGVIDLVRKFNVKSAVIDIRPYEDSARECQKKLKREGVMAYLCEYSESTPMGPQFNANSGICKVNRTETLDQSHRVVVTPGQLNLPRRCPEILTFAKQMCATAKMLDNRRTGAALYRYRKLGTDDYRHAFNYFLLAASSGRVGTAGAAGRMRRRATYATNDRTVGRRTHAIY